MGNSSNTKMSKGRCKCKLMADYNHCCKQQCFQYIHNPLQMIHTTNLQWTASKLFHDRLTEVLQQYNIKYMSSIIVSYLPSRSVIQTYDTNNHEIYNIYYHENISSLYNNGKPPCFVWLNSIKPMDYLYSDHSMISNNNKNNHIEIAYTISDSEDDYFEYKRDRYEQNQKKIETKSSKKGNIFNKFVRSNDNKKDLSKTKSSKDNPSKLSRKSTGNNNNNNSDIELLLIGGRGVGKTSLLNSYYDGNNMLDIGVLYRNILLNPDERYIDEAVKNMNVMNNTMNDNGQCYEYLDVKLIEVEESNINKYIKNGKFFMLICEFGDKRSWEKVIEFRRKIIAGKRRQKIEKKSWGLIIVVTKCDKRSMVSYDDDDDIGQQRLEFVKRNNIPYIELSVSHQRNIHFVFRQTIYEYWIQTQLLPFVA